MEFILPQNAFVFGASGLVGSFLTDLLKKDTHYNTIKVFVRKPMAELHSGIEQVVTDFENLEQVSNELGDGIIFCCLGTTMKKAGSKEAFYRVDFEFPATIAEMGKQAGVKVFVLISSIGADSLSRIFYSRVKGEIEKKIDEMGFEKLIICRPSVLDGPRNEFRIGEKIGLALMKLLSFAMVGKWKKYRPIKASAVAHAMAKLAVECPLGTHIFESDRLAIEGKSF